MSTVQGRWGTVHRPAGRSTSFQAVVAVVIVSLFAVLVVVITVARRPDPPPDGPSEPGVNSAASFLAAVTSADPGTRAQAIGRWVVPTRVPEFVSAFDQTFADRQRARVRLLAQPRGYKIAQRSPNVMEVLVWSRVAGTGARASVSWEISALGVIDVPGGWRVFSYDGTVYGVRPGDPRLHGFVELMTGPGQK